MSRNRSLADATYLRLTRAGSSVGVQRSPDPPTRGLYVAQSRGQVSGVPIGIRHAVNAAAAGETRGQ